MVIPHFMLSSSLRIEDLPRRIRSESGMNRCSVPAKKRQISSLYDPLSNVEGYNHIEEVLRDINN